MMQKSWHQKILLFIVYIFLLSSCEIKENSNQKVPIRKFQNSADIDLLNPKLIRLKSGESGSVGSIEKIIQQGDRIYVLDKLVDNSVFIFDAFGNQITRIKRVGEGPGEYKNVDNLFFDLVLNQLVLIPMDFRKKIYFDQDGNYLTEEFFEHNSKFADVSQSSSVEIIINKSHLNGEDNLQIWKSDKQIASFFPFDKALDTSPLNQRNLLSKAEDFKFNFALGLRDTLYTFDLKNNIISPEFIFDFGNEKSFHDFSNYPNPLQYFMENDFYVGIIDIFQNDEFLTFSSLNNSGIQGRILSKETRKIYSTNDFIQQKIGKVRFEGILGLANDKRFIGVIGKDQTIDWDFSKNPSLESQIKKSGVLDPEELILLFFDLKEN